MLMVFDVDARSEPRGVNRHFVDCGIEESGTEKGSFRDTVCGKAD
jgi:hypothetical protein